MKRATLLVSPELFIDIFKGAGPCSFEVIANALPEDATVVDVKYVNSRRQIAIDLESESFLDVATPPLLSSPVCRVVRDEAEAPGI